MDRPRSNISPKGAMLPRRSDAEMGPQTRYTLQRNRHVKLITKTLYF